jgi:hypothetical protein
VVGTTPAGAEAAAAAVKSTFRRLPLRRHAVAAAVEATTAGAMAALATAVAMVAAVMVVGNLPIKSWLP